VTTLVSDSSSSDDQGRLVRVYMWEWPVRLAHWLIAFSVVVLVVTGIYIGNPFITVRGEASGHFVMGTMKSIHFVAAMVFTLAVLTRILWMFVGNRYARWKEFVPVDSDRLTGIWNTFTFYTFLRRDSPAFVGHNPLAGATYTVVYLLLLGMIGSGFAMLSATAHVESTFRVFDFLTGWFGSLQSARFLHHLGMWLLLGFTAHHVWSAFLIGSVEGTALLDSIFTGYKVLSPELDARGERQIEDDG